MGIYIPMWTTYTLQQGSCDAVLLLCGGLAVQGASPYSCSLQAGYPGCLAEEVDSVDWAAEIVSISQVNNCCLNPNTSYAIAAVQLVGELQVTIVDGTTVQSWYGHAALQFDIDGVSMEYGHPSSFAPTSTFLVSIHEYNNVQFPSLRHHYTQKAAVRIQQCFFLCWSTKCGFLSGCMHASGHQEV